jgi:hypothetical protein
MATRINADKYSLLLTTVVAYKLVINTGVLAMKISRFLLRSGLLAGLVVIGRNIFLPPTPTPAELLKQIDIRCLAALQSTRLALEKSNASLLHAIVQRLSEDLRHEYEQSRKISIAELQDNPGIAAGMVPFLVDYDYNEDAPFDLVYAQHQLNECDGIIAMLHHTAQQADNGLKDIALRTLIIFLRYHTDLTTFLENFLTVNEYRIRELAYQIWESEGRPEGEAARHWAMAEKLANSLPASDWQLALEQKRSPVNSFTTSPLVKNGCDPDI